MTATFRTSKRGRVYEDKDRRNTKAARSCLHGGTCPYCQEGRQHKSKRRAPADGDHIADVGNMINPNMVKCPHCNKQFEEGTPEAEFISWHGICAECELNLEVDNG